METLHGHEVINFIRNAQPTLAQDTLIDTITNEFGNATRFHTCAQSNMSVRDLLDFLVARDKLSFIDGQAIIKEHNVCNDE